jgi:hypothetical protein
MVVGGLDSRLETGSARCTSRREGGAHGREAVHYFGQQEDARAMLRRMLDTVPSQALQVRRTWLRVRPNLPARCFRECETDSANIRRRSPPCITGHESWHLCAAFHMGAVERRQDRDTFTPPENMES